MLYQGRGKERNRRRGGTNNSCQDGTKAEFHREGGASYHARDWEEYNCHQRDIYPENNQQSKGKSVDLTNEAGELDQRERRQGMAGCSEEMDRHLMLCKDEAPHHRQEAAKDWRGTSSAPLSAR